MSSINYVKIRELCSSKKVKKQVKSRLNDEDEVSFLPMSDLGEYGYYTSAEQNRSLHEVYKGYTYFEEGDLLIAKITPCFENGKMGIAKNLTNKVGFGSSEYHVLTPNSKTLVEYLYYFFCQGFIRERGVAFMTGAVGHKRIPIDFFINQSIPYFNYEKQLKIVSKLDQAFEAIDQAIANTEKNIENVEDLRDSYSEQCFKKFPSKSIEIGEVCQLFQGLAVNAKTKHLLVESSSIPLLRIKDLRENTVSQFISEEGYPPNSLIDDEDIIYTRTGSLGLVFRGRRGVLHNNSFKVSPKDSLSKDFLFHYLQLPSFKKKILSLAQRAAQPDITHKIFKKQMLPMFNHENQKIIVHQVEVIKEECSRLKEIQVRKLAMLEKLKMSILEKAFKGELV